MGLQQSQKDVQTNSYLTEYRLHTQVQGNT